MTQADNNEMMRAMAGPLRAKTETERLVERIDADIKKLQDWRAYVTGETGGTVVTAEKKPRKTRKPRGLPLPASDFAGKD